MTWNNTWNKPAAGAFIALVVIGVGLVGFEFWSSKREKRLQAQYGEIVVEMSKALGTSKGSEEEESGAQKTATPEQKAKWAQAFGDIVQEASGSVAAQMSAIQLARLQPDAKQIQLMQTVKVSKSSLSGLFLLSLGNAQAEGGDCKSAVGSWEKIVGQKQWAYLEKEAMMRQALCFDQLQDTESAQKIYAKLSADQESGVYQKLAQKFKRPRPQ